MVHKASIQDIDFHFSENASIKYLVDNIASENDIATLLAELSENAIISVTNSQKRHILLCCSIESSYYSISIFDSGAPFDAEVIEKMGKSRVTTHADSGGSGIGMMTILEIAKKYHASFYLNEIIESDIYNKKITIYFDGLNQFLVESNANSENISIAKSTTLARNASQFETY